MQFFAVAALVAGALAQPTTLEQHHANIMTTTGPVCPDGLFSNAQCCASDILGVIGVDCKVPNETPRDARNFRDICAKVGNQARCCVLPVAGQALLCQPPVGI